MTGYLLSCPVCDGERDFDTAAEADAAERAQTKALRARAKRMRSDAVLALCETSVWNRLDALAVSEGGTVTIYPAFPLRDGGMGDWTIRYERRDPDNRSRRVSGVDVWARKTNGQLIAHDPLVSDDNDEHGRRPRE